MSRVLPILFNTDMTEENKFISRVLPICGMQGSLDG